MADSSPLPVDWRLVEAFLAVVDAGSFTAAGRLLGTTQPTLSRQIAELEATVGTPLFERVAHGVRPTEAGRALVEPALRMRDAAGALAVAMAGRGHSLAGTVRVTASELVSCHLLPPIVRALQQDHPEIQIELLVSNDVENLLTRTADVAIRMVQPDQKDLTVRRLPDLPLGAYAHRDLVARHPELLDADLDDFDPGAYPWVGFDRSSMLIRGFRAAGVPVTREHFRFRTDHQAAAWEAVRAGVGIGIALCAVGDACPHVCRVLRRAALPPLPVYLTAHRELSGTPRMRVVYDRLAAGLGAEPPALTPAR